MARLLGFAKIKPKGAGDSLDLLEKSYLNSTQAGEYNTVEDIDGFLNTLNKLPQTNAVMTRIAELNNKKLQFSTKLDDILSEKNVFDTDLQEALNSAAKGNYKNVKNLIGSYAAIYGDAAERYSSDVISKVTGRYGTTSSVPDETLAYRKQLQDKAKFYSQLFNAYNQRDPKTGEIGTVNPDGFAVLVDTNPANGSINHIDIVPSGEVNGKDYMRTDTGMNVVEGLPNKKLPIYLRTFDAGTTKDGRAIRGGQLGGIVYQGVDNAGKEEDVGGVGVGVLKAHKETQSFWNNPFSDNPTDIQNKAVDSLRENGVTLSSSAYKYDANDVPNGTVLRLGNRMFYSTDKQDEILEISGKNAQEKNDNLTRYLQSVGKDPNKVLPYFVTSDYLTSPDGTSRVKGKVDQNFFSQPLPQSGTAPIGTPPAPAPMQEAPAEPKSSFFGRPPVSASPESSGTTTSAIPQAVNRPSKPEVPQESTRGKVSIGDIIEKGKSFFRNTIA